LLGYLGHRRTVTTDGVLVVGEIAPCFEIAPIVDVDVEPTLEEGEQFLLNRGGVLFTSIEFIGWPPREKLLADIYQLVSLWVLKRQLVAYAEHFSADKKDLLVVFVANSKLLSE
jgi:hypothetical protein